VLLFGTLVDLSFFATDEGTPLFICANFVFADCIQNEVGLFLHNEIHDECFFLVLLTVLSIVERE